MIQGKPFSPHRAFTGVFIPDALIPFRGINAAEKICLARLYRYCDKKDHCWPSQEELAEELGVEVRSIHTYLVHLQEQGFIRIEQRGLGQPNQYVVLGHEVLGATPDLGLLTGNNLPVQTGTTSSDPDRKNLAGLIYRTEENQEEENQAQPQSVSADDLYLNDPVEKFYSQAASRTIRARIRTDRKSDQQTVDKLDRAEREHGREDVRAAWLSYLPHYRENKGDIQSPTAYFLASLERWLPQTSSNGHSTAPAPPKSQRGASLKALLAEKAWESDQSFMEFVGRYESNGASAIDRDRLAGHPKWLEMSPEDRALANERIVSANDPAYAMHLNNYLITEEYTRKPRPKPAPKLSALDDLAARTLAMMKKNKEAQR